MIKCNNCGYIGAYTGILCPECLKKIQLTDGELEQLLEEAKTAIKHREYVTAVENYRILADMGVTEGEREFARMLEAGELIDRSLDGAMLYFSRAAEKNDAYSAWRYSRLASRQSDVSSRFWLSYAALLGCVESYPELAKALSNEGNESEANYYYALAAACDDTDAIVTLAKRYYDGVGAEKNDAYAKWYMDKLMLPPIHAIKLAYRLRGVKAVEPPINSGENKALRIKNLAENARIYGFHTAYLHLNEMLFDLGDMNAATTLGKLYAEGVGCKTDTEKAIKVLHLAAANGVAEAYKYLGDMHLAGIGGITVDGEAALSYYKGAADLGMRNAFELMGDMYNSGELVDRDIAKAVELYDIAAANGSSTAKEKSTEIKDERKALYLEALKKRETAPEEAFRAAAISVAMGYLPAYSKLAEYFRLGVGVGIDRGRAFYWYTEAVRLGDEGAIYDLGLCYSRGIGTALDYKKAAKILTRAMRGGSKEAEAELMRMRAAKMKKLSSQLFSCSTRLLYQRKFEPAKKLLDVCSELNNPRAIYTLGCLYEFGMGVETNRDLAFELYERSYALKFRDPRQVYKLRILRMVK